MIKPEAGRHVHFYPTHTESGKFTAREPHAAIIAHVHGDRMVNLCVFDKNGNPVPKTSVPLVQPDDEVPTGHAHCRWMPYTVESAAKKQS